MKRARELGADGPALGLRPRVCAVGSRCRDWFVRRSSTVARRPDDVSFEMHVDQALRIVRQLPTLSVVPGGQTRKAAPS